MANGDTTGFSLHADFQNGWDMRVLTDIVLGKCQNPSVVEPVECVLSLYLSIKAGRAPRPTIGKAALHSPRTQTRLQLNTARTKACGRTSLLAGSTVMTCPLIDYLDA